MLRIFIGWDSRFPEPADVLAYSLLKHASIPLDIQYLKLDELKLRRAHDPLASTEFTYSRFLVPYLCSFRGKALFLDNDMPCSATSARSMISTCGPMPCGSCSMIISRST